MISLSVLLSAMIAGAALAMIFGALLQQKMPLRQSLFTPFSLLCFSITAIALGQIYNHTSPYDIPLADAITRWNSCFISLVCLGVLRHYPAQTRTPAGRIDKLLTLGFITLAITSIFNPGGLQFAAIERVELLQNPLWGSIIVPHGPPDSLLAGTYVFFILASGRLAWMAAKSPLGPPAKTTLLLAPLFIFFLSLYKFCIVQTETEIFPPIVFEECALIGLLLLALVQSKREETEELYRQRQQLEAALEHRLGFYALLAPDGRLLCANRHALTLAGPCSSLVIGRPFTDTVWWSHCADARSRWQTAILRAASGTTDHCSTTLLCHEGQELDFSFTLTPFYGKDRTLHYLIAEGRDISEAKRYENCVLESTKLKTIEQFASGVSHDFNNSLAGLTCATELALMQSQDSDVRRCIEAIQKASATAARVTRRLLTLVRRSKLPAMSLSVNALVQDTLELFSKSISGKEWSLQRELVAKPDTIQGDLPELQTALSSLCLNGREAMPQGGQLRITTSCVELKIDTPDAIGHPIPAGKYICIAVIDQGAGIPDDLRKRIFEPFFTTKADENRSGFGLPAALRTLHKHRGGLLLHTEAGRGTTFSMLLPASPDG